MDYIEISGKTIAEAKALALQKFDVKDEAELEIVVIQENSKGFLGFGAKDAVIKAKLKFEPEKILKAFLQEVFLSMNIVAKIETKIVDKQLFANILGDDMGVIIGKRGQTLDALQYLTSLVVNKGNGPYLNVILDTENYRKKRKDTLESLAFNLAKKVKKTNKSVVLEPMTAYERRIIHSALQNDRYVTTRSEGVDPHRYIILELKNKQ